MNCEKVCSKLGDLSADALSSREASKMLAHFAQCRSCQKQWEEHQQLLFTVSSILQPLPSQRQSRQMWVHCKQRLTEVEITSRYASPQHRQAMKDILPEQRSALPGWMASQPRWGWVALGGALAVLLGAWFISSPLQPTNTPVVNTAQMLPAPDGNALGTRPMLPATNASLDIPTANNSPVFEAPPTPNATFDGNQVDGNSMDGNVPNNNQVIMRDRSLRTFHNFSNSPSAPSPAMPQP